MEKQYKVSVIIPTYNRQDSVLRLLDSLGKQSLDPGSFEVLVVDDGSSFEPERLARRNFPFAFQLVRQENSGATRARNRGAEGSRGAVLVFIDDDVVVSERTLEALARACLADEARTIAIGTLITCNENESSSFTRVAIAEEDRYQPNLDRQPVDREAHFTRCNTQLLAVRQDHFFELGMLQDPTGGWPNWDDVDFGYRAYLAGFRLVQCGSAIGEHWDGSLATLDTASKRMFRASKSAVRLFQRYPGLQAYIPMYADKVPVNWRVDSPGLILRKLLRRLLSTWASISVMEKVAAFLDKKNPSSPVLDKIYLWMIRGYMLQGYRQGLREFGPVNGYKQAG